MTKWYKQRCREIFDDEMESLDRELREGYITQDEYNKYAKEISRQYEEDLSEMGDDYYAD